MINDIIKRLENGPAVLFIGQKYLSMDYGKDFFLSKTIDKYKKEGQILSNNYDAITKLNLQADKDKALAWMNNLCKSISTPEWLERVAAIGWAAIYTTAIDTVIERAFVNEWRNVQPITDEKFKAFDKRNKSNLHISYLMGSIAENELSKIPPFSLPEKIKRKATYFHMLGNLQEVVTPRGVLIIDGFDLDDQLSIDELYATLSKLNKGQILLCNCTEALKKNELIVDLIETGKMVTEESSFAHLLVNWQIDGQFNLDAAGPGEFYGKWLSIHDQKVRIPQEIVSRISKVGTILDDKIFFEKQIANEDEKYQEFRRFLASTNGTPLWAGFPLQFAFRRDVIDVLLKTLNARIKNSNQGENPIILYGQSSSGKTTALGEFAYQIREQLKLPVLFIEKRYQKVDERIVDDFCIWAEDNGAKSTVVIWDGMLEPGAYFNLLRKLNTRGRKIVLVGSGYVTDKIPEKDFNYIQLPIELSTSEKARFADYLKSVDPVLANIIPRISETNFLAMLYRFLPLTRTRIKSGLKEEFDFFSKILASQQLRDNVAQEGYLSEFLKDLEIVVQDNDSSNEEQFVADKSAEELAKMLIFLVMVPGKYGLKIPFEILLTIIGYEKFASSLFEAMNKVNIISWHEGTEGDFTLGPRTTLEAKLLTDYLGDKATEIEYIKLILMNVSSSSFATTAGESDYQVQFAVELLGKIGPNSQENFYNHLYELTEELYKLRESGQAVHPRLVLKEASFLREIVRKGINELPETSFDLLERAEAIVRDTLDELDQYQTGRTITTYLRVELAAILGTQALEFAKAGLIEAARETYELIGETINYAFSSSRENYNALDVLGWSTIKLIELKIFDSQEKVAAETKLLSFIEIFENEGLSDEHLEEFNNLKLKVYEVVGKQQLADKTFEFLKDQGFASGFYIRARNLIGFTAEASNTFTDAEVSRYRDAYKYLDANFDFIKDDGQCMYLLLKCWWISKTKHTFFADEKMTLNFSENDWEYCLKILKLLLADEVIYQSATTYYLKGVAEFHLELVQDSIETFKILDSETNFSLNGRRRVAKTYLASDENGNPREYSGTVKRQVAMINGQKVGDIKIDSLNVFVPFLLYEFHKDFFQQGEKISKFYIGFNFRGPIAIPFKN